MRSRTSNCGCSENDVPKGGFETEICRVVMSNTVADRGEEIRTNDIRPSDEQWARLRTSAKWSLLANRCLPELERLIDFARDLESEVAPNRRGVNEAAATVLHAYHAKLREFEGIRLDPGVAAALYMTAALARSALHDEHGSRRKVKEVELEAAKGHPLAICVGTEYEVDPRKRAAEVMGRKQPRSSAFGCYRVFPDTTHASGGGHYWSRWCPNCAPASRQRLRKACKRLEEQRLPGV